MPYHSRFFDVDVRDEIAREFTGPDQRVDDMLAGLHEVRARLMATRPWPAAPATGLPDRGQPPGGTRPSGTSR